MRVGRRGSRGRKKKEKSARLVFWISRRWILGGEREGGREKEREREREREEKGRERGRGRWRGRVKERHTEGETLTKDLALSTLCTRNQSLSPIFSLWLSPL